MALLAVGAGVASIAAAVTLTIDRLGLLERLLAGGTAAVVRGRFVRAFAESPVAVALAAAAVGLAGLALLRAGSRLVGRRR